MFRRVLIANRGEIASRIVRACHAVGAEAVAVYSEADAESPHLAEADARICVGPGPAGRSYLDQDAILEAAIAMDCQAIHPGFGFLSENARFVARCEQQKLTVVGPRAETIRRMGDKSRARETMRAAGLPVMPGSRQVLRTAEEARALADEIGYPVLLKAVSGGGGRGMRRVDRAEELEGKFREAAMESESAFSDSSLYMEKFIVGGRHIEFQVLADHWGNAIHLGERECSIQRSHQKLLEEAPAFGMSAEQRHEIGERVREAVLAIGYRNAGTIEFLMDADERLYFMEMNTRIQVEHPVTEMISGVDLVAWQLRIAANERLTIRQEDVTLSGHAIECRINAEDPSAGFRPAPGTVTRFDRPTGEGIRVDSHVCAGYRIPTYYDSMIGKLIVHGADRAEAIARMRGALDAMRIEGVPTTVGLHRAILGDAAFQRGGYTCQFLPEHPELLEAATISTGDEG